MAIWGVVLAGGSSQRFGTNKLRAEVEGRPMLARVVDALREVTDGVAISVRRGGRAELPAIASLGSTTVLEDRADVRGEGPGAGMVTALRELPAEELLFVPGDMPWLSSEALERLRELARQRGASAAAPFRQTGWTEPLVQWQRVAPWAGRLEELPSRSGSGLRPTDLLRGGSSVVLLPLGMLSEDPRCFHNVNEPRDLAPSGTRAAATGDREPVLIDPDATRAFWEGCAFWRLHELARASSRFEQEAALHAEGRISHLELHALEDALRCSRDGGLEVAQLEARLSAVRRALRG